MNKKNCPVSEIGQFSFGRPKKLEIDHTIGQPKRMTKTKWAPLKLQTVHKNFFRTFKSFFQTYIFMKFIILGQDRVFVTTFVLI